MKQILSNKTKVKQIRFDRTLLFGVVLVGVGIVVVVQLFFIQIIKHDYYTAAALAEHAKKFDLPAPRGTISMTDGYNDVPVVLNEIRFEVFADPTYIQDTKATSKAIQGIIGGDLTEIEKQLSTESRYVILAKKIDKSIADRIRDLEIKGIGLKDVPTRSYPQGTLAAHVLGFVNDEGQGQYGFEEYYNQKLTGINGSQTKITDINGVPLAINNKDNETPPLPGANVALTLDLRMQQIVEDKLKSNVERTQSKLGSAVLIDATNGQIKAMANYPTFDPAQFSKQEDLTVFINTAISRQWEPGSVIKPLMMSAAFNENKLNPASTYFDNGSVQVADRVIKNSQNWGAKTMNMTDIITKSLNVGAVHMLKSLGGGEINDKARSTWFDYLNRYNFGKKTGVELAGEQNGIIADPNDVNGVMVTYANMSFGQGMTITPLQLAAAYVPLSNGGTYYQPYLIKSENTKDGKIVHEPTVVSDKVISTETSQAVKSILQTSVERNNKAAVRAGYAIGAKSGTAELVGDDGVYKEGSYNGTYVGYVSGKNKTYVLVVRLDEPKTSGYASTQASITWEQITNEILNSVAIEPL